MSVALKKPQGYAVRAIAPRPTSRAAPLEQDVADIVARMSPDELVLWSSTAGLPTVLAMRVAQARNEAAYREENSMRRVRQHADYLPAVNAARSVLAALDTSGNVAPAIERLREALEKLDAA